MLQNSVSNSFLEADPRLRSLNRARIAELPGVEVDEGVVGKSGYELLSAAALRQQFVALAATLELNPGDPDLIRRFDGCFYNPQTRTPAMKIAQSYGRKLGYLLLMLKRGDIGNRAVRPEWSDEHWAFWRSVRHIHLGGGVVAGNLGRHATRTLKDVLIEPDLWLLTPAPCLQAVAV